MDAGEVETVGGRNLLEERFRALQRQVPLLYIVIFANMVGLYLASGGQFDSLFDFPLLVGALIVIRVAHWLRVRNRVLPPERILHELRKMLIFAVVFSLTFCAWSFQLMATRPATDHDFIILFASLAAIGCAYGVSRYPAAARTPLLLLGLRSAGLLIFTSDAAHIAMGVGLGLDHPRASAPARASRQRFPGAGRIAHRRQSRAGAGAGAPSGSPRRRRPRPS